MSRFILAIGLIGAAFVLQGCNKDQKKADAATAAATAAAVKTAEAATANADCITGVKTVCDAVVGQASAVQVKKLADDGKIVCDGYGVGKIMANPSKYSACKAKLAFYQEAIGGHGYMTDSKNVSHASSLGDWERGCNDEVSRKVLWHYCCPSQFFCKNPNLPGPSGLNATKVSVAADNYIKMSSGKTNFFRRGESTKLEDMTKSVTDNLAELATYTLQYTATARLYDATVPTPTDTYAPVVMISLGAATVMVMGSAALGLKQFLQNRQISYSAAAMQTDEDEEEAAGDE